MQNSILKKRFFFIISVFFIFLLLSHQSYSQERRVDITEMKDTVNWYVTKITKLEKEQKPDQSAISSTRERLVVLMILNLNAACGSLPSPSSKIEILDEYWKCVFDKAPYGKKFYL